MASKKQLEKDIIKLQRDLDKRNKDIQYWKTYTKFLEEKMANLETARDENVLLKNSLANAVADLNNLRWSSGFVHTSCFYDKCIDREYCATCIKNNYKNWKWRGNLI